MGILIFVPKKHKMLHFSLCKHLNMDKNIQVVMSFIEELFDDNKKMGQIFIWAALLGAIVAVIGIIAAAFIDNIEIVAVIFSAVGTFVSAYLLYQFGVELRDNSTDKVPIPVITKIIGPFIDHSDPLTRVSIFSGIVKLIGISLIVSGLFTAIGMVAAGLGAVGIGTAVLMILIGLVFLWASREISKGGDHSFMWILLLILFILSLLVALISLFNIATLAQGLLWLILSGYAIYLCMSDQVKAQMKA